MPMAKFERSIGSLTTKLALRVEELQTLYAALVLHDGSGVNHGGRRLYEPWHRHNVGGHRHNVYGYARAITQLRFFGVLGWFRS